MYPLLQPVSASALYVTEDMSWSLKFIVEDSHHSCFNSSLGNLGGRLPTVRRLVDDRSEKWLGYELTMRHCKARGWQHNYDSPFWLTERATDTGQVLRFSIWTARRAVLWYAKKNPWNSSEDIGKILWSATVMCWYQNWRTKSISVVAACHGASLNIIMTSGDRKKAHTNYHQKHRVKGQCASYACNIASAMRNKCGLLPTIY